MSLILNGKLLNFINRMFEKINVRKVNDNDNKECLISIHTPLHRYTG